MSELLRLELVARVRNPHRDQAALMLAQIALETARGTACQNHNVGNISASDQMAGEFYRPPWFNATPNDSPRMQELNAAMKKGRAPRAFRSFPDFARGVAGYVSVARSLGIVDAADTGDAGVVAQTIARAYTPDAPVASTTAALDSLRNDYLRRGLFDPLPKDSAAPTPRDSGLR